MDARIKKALTMQMVRAFCCVVIAGLVSGCAEQGASLDDPAVVYGSYCFACHDTGAAGAPVFSYKPEDKAVWRTLAGDAERLYQVTLTGRGAMPAKGTCFDCTDEQLIKTVDWMLLQSQ